MKNAMAGAEFKQEAAVRAAGLVVNGQRVGLGTGSTAAFAIQELGRRVREEGLPRFQTRGSGNLYVRVLYDIPKNPGRKLRKSLEALAGEESGESGPARRRFADELKAHMRDRRKK